MFRGSPSKLMILVFDPQSAELFAKFCELFSFPNYSTDHVYFYLTNKSSSKVLFAPLQTGQCS